MLKNHSHGDTCKEIRDLASHVEAYVPPIPDPDKKEQTRAQKILYSMLKFILRIIELALLTDFSEGGVRGKSKSDIRRENLPKYYEQLKEKSPKLMDVLDFSMDSIWLATYMVEEGAAGCPLAISAFDKHLKQCTWTTMVSHNSGLTLMKMV